LVGSSASRIDDSQDRDDESDLEHQDERGGAIGERVAAAYPEGVKGDQDDGLDGDAAEDAADGDAHVAG
jgi:hypothetical protein